MRIFILAIILLSSSLVSSQNTVTVHGQIINAKSNKVYIRYYEDHLSYNELTADSAVLDRNGKFAMEFDWTQPAPATFFHGDEITEMFLCPGDNLHLTLDTKQFDDTVAYTGDGSTINKYMAQKALKFSHLNPSVYKLEEQDFVKSVDSFANVQIAFLEHYFMGATDVDPCKQAFLDWEYANIDYDGAGMKISYPGFNAYLNKRSGYTEVSSGYYDFLDELKVFNAQAMQSYTYVEFLSDYINYQARTAKALDSVSTWDQIKSKIINEQYSGVFKEYVYAEWIYNTLTEQNDVPKARELLNTFNSFANESSYLNILNTALASVKRLQAGNEAPGFSLRDTKNRLVSLKDFGGKVVYLDFWATWCGPCITEIPASEKLIEELEGEDIVFLMVSIDDSSKAWKKFVRKKAMQGIHLISSGNFQSEVAKAYNITGIPRYVIIDRDGIIVDSNAERPGSVKDDLLKALD